MTDAQPDRGRSRGALQPARCGPEEHQLRRRQHLRQGRRDRPGDRRGRRAGLGEGLRGRPRHAEARRPRGAAARPDARAGGRLPGRRARGRDGRGVRLLPARQGRCGAVDRHRDARARRLGARRPPAPRLRHRDRDRGRRRGADPQDLRRHRRLGAVAASRLPARPRHRRDQGEEPAGDRLHPRWPRRHRVGRHQRGVRGQLAEDHRHGGGVPRGEQQGRAVRPRPRRVRRTAGRRASRQGGCHRADGARDRLEGPADGRPLHRLRRGARLPGLRGAPAAGRARHQLPRPLPAHQGQADGARPARHRLRRGDGRAAQGAARALPRGLPGLLRPQRDAATRRPSVAPTR